ncbi:MAG: PDZ domain-containing protein [Deltaproteobacteria bacterium]|nr:PDZ domain-containing protein [Deltaproteobacteria bacterium]
METVFKKQFWLVNLLFLAGAAYLLARGSNQFVALALVQSQEAASAAEPRGRTAPPVAARGKTVKDLDEDANIFGARPEPVLEGAAAEAAARAAEDAKNAAEQAEQEAVPTQLRLKLVGITWFGVPAFSLCNITDLAGNTTTLHSINVCPPPPPAAPPPDDDGTPPPPAPVLRTPCNQITADATLTSIEPDRVIFFNRAANRREYLELYEDPKKSPPPPQVSSAPPPPTENPADLDGLGKGITKVADNQYRIPQADIDEVMQNLNAVATQARIVPSFENGKSNGFKLFSIRPNSIFNKIGMQNGDVISKINGYDMSTPDKALEVYNKLKDAKEINVEMNRRGQKMTMSYGIQ